MTLSTWLAFLPATFLISITPGPNMMLMLTIGVQRGLRQTIPAMCGAMLVVLAMIVASSLGLAVILESSPRLFLAIKWAGALYLAWLGLQLLLNLSAKPMQDAEVSSLDSQSASVPTNERSVFWQAAATAGSNPKAIVFAAAYFPQFINTQHSAWPQLAILLPTFILIETACYFLYAISGVQLASWFNKPQVLQNFNRCMGLIFIGFAVALALYT